MNGVDEQTQRHCAKVEFVPGYRKSPSPRVSRHEDAISHLNLRRWPRHGTSGPIPIALDFEKLIFSDPHCRNVYILAKTDCVGRQLE